MAMRHEGGEERPNVPRSAVESGEAARDEAPSAVAGGNLSPRWKCGRLHGRECSAETGADERPLIAVSVGNFNTAFFEAQRNKQQNALAAYPADGKTGEKGCMFTALWR